MGSHRTAGTSSGDLVPVREQGLGQSKNGAYFAGHLRGVAAAYWSRGVQVFFRNTEGSVRLLIADASFFITHLAGMATLLRCPACQLSQARILQ